MGPHPAVAATRSAVRAALASLGGPQRLRAAGVVVACSGGADSLALAAAVAFEAPGLAAVVGVDHGLQPGSGEVLAAAFSQLDGSAFREARVVRVEVERRGGPEAAARAARYAALDDAAAGRPLLLGHTLDDQAETVLLALARGSGPSALRAMASTPGRVRPFLGVRRATTRAACEAQGLAPWDDPHNDDPRFTRVRVRREVLPLLEDVLGGGVAEALARTAAQVRDDAEVLDALAAQVAAPGPELAVGEVAALAPAVRRRVLKAWCERAGAGPLTAVHVAAVDRLVTHWHGQGVIDLPGGFGARRVSGTLSVMPCGANPTHRNPR